MKWSLEKRNISDLLEYARNPRRLSKHDAKHLQESLDKFGQCEPIVINCDNTIVGGHQRLRTLKKLKYKEVDVYVPDTPLSDKEVEELNIRLNRNSGEWDDDMLANAWDLGDLLDWGFIDKDLSIDSGVLEESENAENKDSELSSDIKTKDAEEYHLGDHTLICVKPNDINAIMELLEVKSALTIVAPMKQCNEILKSWMKKHPGSIHKKFDSNNLGEGNG